MPTTDYNPVSFNGEPLTQAKMNQLSNNVQYIFERQPRMRYSASGLTSDTGLKIIAGKTPFSAVPSLDYVFVPVYFGSFFSQGVKPVVTALVEIIGGHWRKYVSVQGLGGGEIDQNGFMAAVVSREVSVASSIDNGGWVHWQAVGY